MESLSDFLAMGGYAAYVWPAVGLTLAVLVGFALASWRSLARTRRQLALLEADRRARRQRAAGAEAPR